MAILSETRFIERLQFFNGQRLFASDLQGLEEFNREMRWLHNKSLHQPGVGSGFAVYGRKEDREIRIKPGYAIDSLGREIVLTETWIEPVPPVASEDGGKSIFYDLTVSYPEDSYLEEAETREGICLPRGVVRLREGPVFCWIRLKRDDQDNLHPKNTKLQGDIRDGLKIVLVRAEVLNCQLNKDLSIAERRSARPAKQPYIACGMVDPTEWQPLEVADPKAVSLAEGCAVISPCSLTAEINTANAGFLNTPCYSARIAGPRIFVIETGTNGKIAFIVDSLLNIRDPRPTGFTADVLLILQRLTPGLRSETGVMSFLVQSAAEGSNCSEFFKNTEVHDFFSKWHIIWMGIEG